MPKTFLTWAGSVLRPSPTWLWQIESARAATAAAVNFIVVLLSALDQASEPHQSACVHLVGARLSDSEPRADLLVSQVLPVAHPYRLALPVRQPCHSAPHLAKHVVVEGRRFRIEAFIRQHFRVDVCDSLYGQP